MDCPDKWRNYVWLHSSKYGLESECLSNFDKYIIQGYENSHAAWMALYDWDV